MPYANYFFFNDDYTFEEDVFLGTLGRPVLFTDIRQRNKILKPKNTLLNKGWLFIILPDHLH